MQLKQFSNMDFPTGLLSCIIFVAHAISALSECDMMEGKHGMCNVQSDIGTLPKSIYSNKIYKLMENYDRLQRPDADKDLPTEVVCDIFFNGIDSISVDTMDFSVNIYLRQSWVDPRLAYKDIYPNISTLTLDTRLFDNIWVPDLFFANEKDSHKHCITVPNRLIRIYPDGRILYSSRYSLTLACHMSLENFPMDRQECHVILESYGYTEDEIQFVWRNDTDPIQINEDLEFPQFDLVGHEIGRCRKSYITGNFTCLKSTFFLHRQFGYYMIQNYIPTALIVVLSWVSFWINIDAVPARISLGVLTVLTMTTQCVGVWMSLPRVSYVKAIDIWMSMSVLYVFLAMLEFAIVNTLARKEIRKMSKRILKNVSPNDDGQSSHQVKIKQMLDEYTYGVPHKLDMKSRLLARTVDKASRLLFPLAYFIFNLAYWIVFLSR